MIGPHRRLAAVFAALSLLTAVRAADLGTAAVEEFTVNGLKVLLKQRPASQTVAVGLFIKGGARNITRANAGIEALTLDLSTEATMSFPRERMRRELARTASAVSFGVNRDYSLLSLATTRQYFGSSWDIFVDAALHPRLAPEDFAIVKQRRLTSLSDDQDSPDSLLALMAAGVVYAGHPYQVDPRGTTATVSALTLEDVKAFHARLLQTSRMLLVVVGDIDAAEVQRRVRTAFAKVPVGSYRDAPPPPFAFAAPTVAVTPRELPTNYVQGVYAAPPLTSPDIYPMQVATSILRNRIFEEVRVRRSLSYAPDAFLSEFAANTGGIYVTAVDANQAVRVMLDEVAKLQTEAVSADELKATAQSFLTSHYLDQETNAAQAGELAKYELVGGGWRTSTVLLDRLRAVSSDDVERVARTYMRNIQFVVVGDPQKVDRQVFTRQPAAPQ